MQKVLLSSTPSGSASNTSSVCKSCDLGEKPVCLLASVLIIQGLGTAVLALIQSLVMVLTSPQCLQSSGVCTLLLYLDPGLSLLAVIVLIVIAMPQVRFCVSRPSHHVCCTFVLSRPALTVAVALCNWSLSPGVQVWNAFATGHTSTHLHIRSWTENQERPWGAGFARPPHLAVD